MSQITRCPSCSTTFKVVADQLRISEGWVRCGQCKEVFDASAHLLPAPAPALLPDVSLTDVRPPPAPVARKAETERAWGAPPSPPPPSSSPVPAPAPAPAAPALPVQQTPPVEEPVLAVPDPAVPAFLSAGAGSTLAESELRLEPLAPFVWRARTAPPEPAPERSALPPPPPAAPVPPASPVPAPAGYELPAADLPDLDEDALDMPSFEETRPAMLDLDEYPPLELPPPKLPQPPAPASAPVPVPDVPARAEATVTPPPPAEAPAPAEPVAAALPPVDFPRAPVPPEPEALALVDDDSPAAVLQASARRMSRGAADDGDGEPSAEEEVSFVVAARRKAFWRKPAVRAVLLLVLLLAVAALALQVAVQERDRIAAMDARARPWLVQLCVPLHCKIAPPRQIDNVVIDSSSFNKARGDSYQLALTVKSKAAMALAMPAVELTLTDAQDQAVLRRVLHPADLGAPAELPARGEWSTSVSVIVTTGGARVAGYRVLVFYP